MKKNVWTIVLTLVLCLVLFAVPALAAEDGIPYVEYSWNEGTSTLSSTPKSVSVTECTEVTSGTTTWTEGWYVVTGEVTITTRVKVEGHVRLILADGCNLIADQGISVEPGYQNNAELTIYGQKNSTGKLSATGVAVKTDSDYDYYAGIGSKGIDTSGNRSGPITIHGGQIYAKGSLFAAGIGCGGDGSEYWITIYHGTVFAESGGTSGISPAIGGITGRGNTSEGYLRIYGGTVTAQSSLGPALGGSRGNSILIAGGVVNASYTRRSSSNCAIIGTYGRANTTPSVTISGGVVNITKGEAKSYFGDGYGNESRVSITGGIVYRDNLGIVYGETTLEQDLEIPTEKGLLIPEGATLTIPAGKTLTNNGTLQITDENSLGGDGTLTGGGTYTRTAVINIPEDLTYTGVDLSSEIKIEAQTPIEVKYKTFQPISEDKVSFSSKPIVNAGNYTVTCDLLSEPFTVAKAKISVEKAEQDGILTYSGGNLEVCVSVDAVTVDRSDATVKYSWSSDRNYSTKNQTLYNPNAGEYVLYYKATADNHEDYIGSIKIVVNPLPLTADNTTATFRPMTYNGQPQTPVADLVVDLGDDIKEPISGVTWSAVTNVTDTTIAIVENTNFTGNVSMPTGMQPLDFRNSVEIEAVNSPIYDGTLQTQNITVKEPGGNIVTGYTVSGNKKTNAGDYILTVSAGSSKNYTGEKTFEWNIAHAPLTATAVIPETYWGETPVIENVAIEGTMHSSDVVYIAGLTASVADATAVGNSVTFNVDSTNSVISGSGFENYNVTIADTAVGNVKVIPLTISGVKMAAETYTYGEAVGCDITNLSFAQPGGTAANAEDLVYTYTGTANDGTTWNSTDAPTKAGSYTLTVSYNDTVHYEVTPQVLNFTINKAPATVTVKDQRYHVGTKLPDGSAPELDKHYTVDGLFGEDSIGTVTMKYQKDGEDVTPDVTKTGTYDIVILVADVNSNYDITIVNGTLTYYYIPTYTPTMLDTEGGDVTISDRHPAKGQTVTITPKPDAGMMVDTVTVTDSKGNEIEVTKNSNGTYSFRQPAGSVTIQVTFKPETCPSEAYSDLDPNAWYHEAADYVLHKGLMNGVGVGKFNPNGTTSRAMIVTILWRLEGEPVYGQGKGGTFVDVPEYEWYTEAMEWAAANGIVEGWNGNFDPMGEITREQFATILWRYAKYKGYDVSVGEDTNILSYEDAFSVSEYAIPAMQWACGAGLMQGDGVNLTPKADATRAQAAALFQRFCENVAET